MTQLELRGIPISVIHKDIRNIHLSVHPPQGSVRISAPLHTPIERIRLFALARLDWIEAQRMRFWAQEREEGFQYIHREGHYFRGRRYLLRVEEHEGPPAVEALRQQLLLRVRVGATHAQREAAMHDFYRAHLRSVMPAIISHWEQRLGVKASSWGIRRMKTRWGSCTPLARRIWLNLELAKKPDTCLEYVVLHELLHLIDPTHGPAFQTLLERHMPTWKSRRDELNRLPVIGG